MKKTGPTPLSPASDSGEKSIFSQIQAHIPLPSLREKLSLFLNEPLNPEIYFDHRAMKRISEEEMAELADALKTRGRSATVHGPFYDLSPGAIDPAFRSLTADRMLLALKKARLFSPRSIVFHPGYDPLRFGEHRTAWLKNSIRTWNRVFSETGKDALPWILLENIFERDPFTLSELLDALPSPPFGFCFDTGHFQVFSDVPLRQWLEVLGPHLREVHLHDNHGQADEHLPPGKGVFDFHALFGMLSQLSHPVIGTIEAHSEPHLREALAYLESRGIRG